MRLRGLALLVLFGVVACQSPAPPTPTPTVARAPTQAAAAVPTPVPTPVPTLSPTALAPAVGSSRVDVLNSANAAFTRGDATAAELYERVLNTPPTGESADTTKLINGFAHFRAIVTLLMAGREDDARVHLDALQQSDPSAPLARLANQLWDQYGMVGQLGGACAQLQPQIASQAGPTLTALQGLGVSVDAQTLCSRT